MDFTDDTKHPEIPEGEGRKAGVKYINDTKNLWVRKCRAEDAIEIWYDGHYVLGWAGADKIECRLQTLMRAAFDLGKSVGDDEAKAALRKALGL